MDSRSSNRQERRKQRTRRKLKEAALALVLEKGFDQVTIQDVVDRADLGRGTFYVHYSNLQDVLWAVIQDGLTASMQAGRTRSADSAARPGYLGYLITFETAARQKDLYCVMLGGKGSALITHRVADYLAANIEKGVASGQFMEDQPFPPAVTAQVVVGALMRLVLWWLETPNDYTPHQMADMIYTLLHGVSPALPED